MNRRPGMTLIELLVAIFVIAILVALLLPAVQMARSAAHRAGCANNLRQIGLSIHMYHDSHGKMPALYNGYEHMPRRWRFLGAALSWQALLLPGLEQQNLFNQLDFSKEASHNTNLAAIKSVLPIFLCPATPTRFPNRVPTGNRFVMRGVSRFDGQRLHTDFDLMAAVCDYWPNVELRDWSQGPAVVRAFGGWGEVYRDRIDRDPWRGEIGVQRTLRFADIQDGLSNTLLVTEMAGMPNFYVGREYRPEEPTDPEMGVTHNAWAVTHSLLYLTYSGDAGGPINTSNATGPYAFHAGVNSVFGDGSVHFLRQGMAPAVFASLVSRDGGEPIDAQVLQ
ncbi:MAG: DUF1559 domain-containing protein [Pirellulales bacterium]